jgi:hypothetical protein
MSVYIVEVRTVGRESYAVDANSEEEARKNWHEGALQVSEVLDTEVSFVRIDDPE